MNALRLIGASALRHEERGATAVEYALVASLIAAVIVSAVTLLGQDVQGLFETVRW